MRLLNFIECGAALPFWAETWLLHLTYNYWMVASLLPPKALQIKPQSQMLQVTTWRTPPWAVQRDLFISLKSQELKKLVKPDVIEPIESSELVSPIVVTMKRNGGICL